MIKKVTKKWLKEKSACKTSLDYVCANDYIGLPPVEFIRKLMSEDRFPDANWFIVRIMDKRQKVQYSIFAAEQVPHKYGEKSPDNKTPRKVIESAKKYVENPCEKTKTAAAATFATFTVIDIYAAAVAYAVAAVACDDPAVTATSAAYAAVYAYSAANAFAADAEKELQVKIIENGIKILKTNNNKHQ